jgi:hypothetical protein
VSRGRHRENNWNLKKICMNFDENFFALNNVYFMFINILWIAALVKFSDTWGKACYIMSVHTS